MSFNSASGAERGRASRCDSWLKQSQTLIKVLVNVCGRVEFRQQVTSGLCRVKQHYITSQILLEAFVLQYTQSLQTVHYKYYDLTYKWKYDRFRETIEQSS